MSVDLFIVELPSLTLVKGFENFFVVPFLSSVRVWQALHHRHLLVWQNTELSKQVKWVRFSISSLWIGHVHFDITKVKLGRLFDSRSVLGQG